MSQTVDECDRNDVYAAMCPCRDMLDLLANKWSALAIGALEDGPKQLLIEPLNIRFSDDDLQLR